MYGPQNNAYATRNVNYKNGPKENPKDGKLSSDPLPRLSGWGEHTGMPQIRTTYFCHIFCLTFLASFLHLHFFFLSYICTFLNLLYQFVNHAKTTHI